MHSETSKIAKTPKGPFEKKKKIVSNFAEILCVRPFNHKDFRKKKFNHFHFLLIARGNAKNFDVKNFKFSKNKVRNNFTGSWQILKGTKS